MIGYLKGTLDAKRPPWLTLEVAGVGYELEAPMSTFYRLPEVGRELTLVTHLLVREDAHSLYGFLSEAERALFRSLLKVTGVGARIVAETLHRAMEGSRHSIVREPDWRPTLGPVANRFTMPDLLLIAYDNDKDVLAPLGD